MEVNYKRVNDTDGELTLRFSDYKELTRFLEVTKCRSFVLAHHARGKQPFRRGHCHLQPL